MDRPRLSNSTRRAPCLLLALIGCVTSSATTATAQRPRLEVPPDPENGLATLGYMRRLSAKLRDCAPWHTSADAALQEAKAHDKHVLTFVIADGGDQVISAHERALADAALLEPALRALLLDKFVLLRIRIRARQQLDATPQDTPRQDDPLAALGTHLGAARSPALLISTARGRLVARLTSIGTWSQELLYSFVHTALRTKLADATGLEAFRQASDAGDHTNAAKIGATLAKSGLLETPADRIRMGVALVSSHRPQAARAWLAPSDDAPVPVMAASKFWDGVALAALGEKDAAQATWLALRELTEDTAPWGLRAELRGYWHESIEGLRAAGPTRYAAGQTTTELARDSKDAAAVELRAAAFLLRAQKHDGRFAHATQYRYDAAVTALTAGSLARVATTDDGLAQRIDVAIARATQWLGTWLHASAAHPATADSWGAAYALEYLAGAASRDTDAAQLVPAAVDLLVATQLESGAWSYDYRFGTGWRGGFGGWPKTDKGRGHSINTALALWALARARRAGFDLPAEALDRGLESMGAMRSGPTTLTYTWPEPRNFESAGQSLGRATVALQALVAFDRAEVEELETALEEFMAGHGDLRRTAKLTSAWIGPGNTSSYFFLQSFFHAADALQSRPGPRSRARLRQLRDELLRVVEVDGTWVDYEASGKVYGTAMALHVLTRAR